MTKILIKISGEYLELFNENKVAKLIKDVKRLLNDGYKVSIVVGGGNIIRQKDANMSLLDDHELDLCGIKATEINAMMLHYALRKIDIQSKVVLGNECDSNELNIFARGINTPYFSTDMAAMVRGRMINADYVIKATNTDGIYNVDPKVVKDAVRIDKLSHDEYLEQNLKCLDETAIRFARKYSLKVQVISINDLYENITRKAGSFIE